MNETEVQNQYQHMEKTWKAIFNKDSKISGHSHNFWGVRKMAKGEAANVDGEEPTQAEIGPRIC
jgi:hypothetical protein